MATSHNWMTIRLYLQSSSCQSRTRNSPADSSSFHPSRTVPTVEAGSWLALQSALHDAEQHARTPTAHTTALGLLTFTAGGVVVTATHSPSLGSARHTEQVKEKFYNARVGMRPGLLESLGLTELACNEYPAAVQSYCLLCCCSVLLLAVLLFSPTACCVAVQSYCLLCCCSVLLLAVLLFSPTACCVAVQCYCLLCCCSVQLLAVFLFTPAAVCACLLCC